MRGYELLIGVTNLLVFGFTAGRALARQQAFAHEIPEQITVSPISNAQNIVEALVGDTVSGREFALIEGAAPWQGRPEMRGARDGTACHVLSELQQNERGQRIGGVLLAPEYRYLEEVEHRMGQFMQHDIDKGPDHRVFGREPLRGRRG